MHNPNPYKHILILGANSDMAKALLLLLFSQWEDCHFYLLARNTAALSQIAEAGKAKGHTVKLCTYDLLHPSQQHFLPVDCCLVFAGWLPPDNTEPEKAMAINYSGIKLFIENLITDNTPGIKQIIITGSVAGVRVRPANKAYGQAKAALHLFTKELQQKWAGKIAVTLVIPGYVSTKMIEGHKTPGMLTISPQQMATKYLRYLTQQPGTAYSQPIWKIISVILKLLPAFVIKRMKF